MSLLIAVGQAVTGSLGIKDVLLVTFWLAFIPYLRWVGRRATERARRAEAAAVRLVRPGAG